MKRKIAVLLAAILATTSVQWLGERTHFRQINALAQETQIASPSDAVKVKENTQDEKVDESIIESLEEKSNESIGEGETDEIGNTEEIDDTMGAEGLEEIEISSETEVENLAPEETSSVENVDKNPGNLLEERLATDSNVQEGIQEKKAVDFDENGFSVNENGEISYEPAIYNNGVYEISNAGQLYWYAGIVNGDSSVCKDGIEQKDNARGKLISDIDLSCSTEIIWTPIGEGDQGFDGVFEGNGHTIYNLYINNEKDKQGLFGKVNGGHGSAISDLNIESAFIHGANYVGALAGLVDWGVGAISGINIADSQITGKSSVGGCTGQSYSGSNIVVTDSEVKGEYDVGGIIGSYYFLDDIYNCVNYSTVEGEGNIGGIVGSINFCNYTANKKIMNCYNQGDIIGDDSAIGGIIGDYDIPDYVYTDEDILIVGCFNSGNIYGNHYVGGIIGSALIGTRYPTTKCENCYNRGCIKGEGNVGGIVGGARYALPTKYCYNAGILECSGFYYQIVDNGSSNASYHYVRCGEEQYNSKPLSYEQMQEESSFQGWDFDEIWSIDSDHNGGFPYLKWSQDIVGNALFENGDIEAKLKSNVYLFKNWDSENKIASFFPSWESVATEKTDISFLDNIDSFLNNYVLVTTESIPGDVRSNLISIQPVETRRGIVTEVTDEYAVIDGESYQYAEGFDADTVFGDGDAVYHLIDGRICNIDFLTWSKEGQIDEWEDDNTFEFSINLNGYTYKLNPSNAQQIKEKLSGYDDSAKVRLLTDSLNIVHDVNVSGDPGANFAHYITKFISYNQETKEATTYDNKTYILSDNLYSGNLMNQWVYILVSVETGNVVKSIETFKPDIAVYMEMMNQGPVYVSNGKYSYDGKNYHDRNDFSIPFRFTVENQKYSSSMITPEMKIMMQNDGVDFNISPDKITFDLPGNFSWIKDKKIELESGLILEPGEEWTAEGAIKPQFLDSFNNKAERQETIQVTVKWNGSKEDQSMVSFTLKNMDKVEKALAEIEKGSKQIAKKAEAVNILKLQTSGLVTKKQLEEINASVAVWLSTITNPDCPDAIKKGMFDSYEYNTGNGVLKSTFKIPAEVADGNTVKKVNFVFRAVIRDFNFSNIWEQTGLKLGSLGMLNTVEWKLEGLSKYGEYQLCSVEASANIGNLNSAISEYKKSAVKEIKEVLTSKDSIPFNEAIEKLPDPESYLTSLIRTMLINLAKGEDAITPEDLSDWIEESYGKIVKIKCPVDVYVYHDGVECARIINNQLDEKIAQTTLGSIASVSGDEKTLILLDSGYEIELVGNDTGTMDYIVEEYSNFGNEAEPRIIKFDNLPLTKGKKYTGHINDQTMKPKEEYALESDGKNVIPDYDTLEGDEIKDLPSGNTPDGGNQGSGGSGGHSSGGSGGGGGGSFSSLPGGPGTETGTVTVDPKKGRVNSITGIITGTEPGFSRWIQDERGWKLLYADNTYACGTILQETNGQPYEQITWELINGAWFAFGVDSYLKTGFIYDHHLAGWFYVDVNTGMSTNWQLIGSTWYYFSPVSDGTRGKMAADTWIDGYYVNKDGAWEAGKAQE